MWVLGFDSKVSRSKGRLFIRIMAPSKLRFRQMEYLGHLELLHLALCPNSECLTRTDYSLRASALARRIVKSMSYGLILINHNEPKH